MEVTPKTVNLGKLLNEYLSSDFPKTKPETIDDKKLVALTVAAMNSAHSTRAPISDISLLVLIERHLKPYKIDVTIEEYVYVSQLMDELVDTVKIDEPKSSSNHIQ